MSLSSLLLNLSFTSRVEIEALISRRSFQLRALVKGFCNQLLSLLVFLATCSFGTLYFVALKLKVHSILCSVHALALTGFPAPTPSCINPPIYSLPKQGWVSDFINFSSLHSSQYLHKNQIHSYLERKRLLFWLDFLSFWRVFPTIPTGIHRFPRSFHDTKKSPPHRPRGRFSDQPLSRVCHGKISNPTVDGWNPVNSPVEVGGLSHYL